MALLLPACLLAGGKAEPCCFPEVRGELDVLRGISEGIHAEVEQKYGLVLATVAGHMP